MHGEQEIEYLHPKLEPILKETYGITVYQEQIMYTAMNLADYTASEADFLRKAVAKKKQEVLLKQRDRFVSGAVKNDIPEDVANAIFDNWEAFARYGFPKGHAADYGVISVQTGYLKTHYPVEYMTALLAVEQNNTDKVTLYVADCRRMGLDVLPPDINASHWDFSIEDREDGTSAIRFGLGAVKNVGFGPVDIVCEARAEGPFTNINDFVRRVDLRKVGKRALESLIKVGALDIFGPRPALLEGLDRIISISASNFKAADMGQMSLFGAQTGLVATIELPTASVDFTRREQLNWERELIGVYISDHPLSPVMDAISQNVTHYAGDLAEAQAQQIVRVAGLITRIRPHTTKKGDPMAFVTLEDLQGNIDLVIFPRTWKQVEEFVQWDAIVMVDGKVDTYGAEPKILVDKITTELKHVTPLEESVPKRERKPRNSIDGSTPLAVSDKLAEPPKPYSHPEPLDEPAWDVDAPPPPETFPPGWGGVLEPTPEKMPVEAYSELISAAALEVDISPVEDDASETHTKDVMEPDEAELPSEQIDRGIEPEVESEHLETEAPTMPVEVAAAPQEMAGPPADPAEPVIKAAIPDKIVTPFIPPMPSADGKDIHMVTVVLRPRADKVRDNLLLRRVFGLMISYPGNDRFAFHIFENNRGHLLEFPNLTTGLNPELMTHLNELVGPENVRVEPITFQ
jgi:DNA polymerase-3 subunit alpha